MKTKKQLTLALLQILLLLVIGQTTLKAADTSPEAKMRENLRNTLLQLRDAQQKVNTMTISLEQAEKDKTDLKKQIEDLKVKMEAEKKAAEKERIKLNTQIALLQRKVNDHETKNVEMAKLAQEILTRYEKFGLGDALTAREPFIGTTRVKIENYVQDFKDKIDDQKITHGSTAQNAQALAVSSNNKENSTEPTK